MSNLQLANVSRRRFLKGLAASGALVLAARWDVALGAEGEEKQYGGPAMPHGVVDDPNVFIEINPDGTVTIVNHRSEMGQGIRTSLLMVCADELDADWDKVRVEQAEGDEERYGNQNTDGSRSMRHWFDPMRRAAAAARTMLEQAAANQWQVPLNECKAEIHKVVHQPSGRELSFGDLAEAASQLDVPARESLQLKNDSELRFVGKELNPLGDAARRPKAIDGEDIVTGTAIFGADVKLENMVHAVVVRPPVLGATLKSVDNKAALKVPGVIKTLTLKGSAHPAGFEPLGGVVVVAENTWAAMQGRQQLKIEWDLEAAGDNAKYNSQAYREELEKAARSPGKVIRSSGDIETALEQASEKIEATYYMPHMAHATMEPPVALVRIQDGKAEAWAPVQNPGATREGLAQRLGLDMKDVEAVEKLQKQGAF